MALVALLSTISLNTLYLTYSKATQKGVGKIQFCQPLVCKANLNILKVQL